MRLKAGCAVVTVGLAVVGCGERGGAIVPAPATAPALAIAPIPADAPPCFRRFPLALGARWTYDVELSSDAGTRRARVEREVTAATHDGVSWHFRIDSKPVLADSEVAAEEHFVLTGARLYDDEPASPANLRLIDAPEQEHAWGGPPGFYPPGEGTWTLDDLIDIAPYRACVRVHAQTRFGEIRHVYCPEVGPIASDYHERTPRSRADPTVDRHDETWRLVAFSPGHCAK